MQNTSITDLPKGVRLHLPEHAQKIYMAAYNNALNEYADAAKRHGNESVEETAARVAWGAVERSYQKSPDGTWHPIAK